LLQESKSASRKNIMDRLVKQMPFADRFRTGVTKSLVAGMLVLASATRGVANPPNPQLSNIFPAGAKAGSTVEVSVAGSGLGAVESLYCSDSRISSTKTGKQLSLTIPADVGVGHYDIYAVTKSGLSSPRSFIVGNRSELNESEPNDTVETAQAVSNRGARNDKTTQSVPLGTVVNGRLEKSGDRDCFSFNAIKGQLVVIECTAERLDSKLRAVIELFDSKGKRLAVNRGFFGVDPLIDFRVQKTGQYTVRVDDRVFSGSADHVYRLAIDSGPRVAFAYPPVIGSSKNKNASSQVTLFGWNLNSSSKSSSASASSSNGKTNDRQTSVQGFGGSRYESMSVQIPTSAPMPTAMRLGSIQTQTDLVSYHLPGSHAPVLLSRGGTVQVSSGSNRSAESPDPIQYPGEVVGQLVEGNQVDWFSFEAVRGEVLYFEGFGQRIGSPMDLDISLLDGDRIKVAGFSDQIPNMGGKRFPSNHLDPSGRCVIPSSGRYLIAVRTLTGGLKTDPRRIYRLTIQREVPDVSAVIVPRLDASAAVNILSGGRTALDVVVFRRRGLSGSIRVQASDLPAGYECPDVWLGPNVDRAPLVLTARPDASNDVQSLDFRISTQPFDENSGTRRNSRPELETRRVLSSSVVRTGRPNGWSRLTSVLPVQVSGQSQVKITANAHEIRKHDLYGDLKPRHAPGSIVDVAVQVDRRDAEYQAAVDLIGIGVPLPIKNRIGSVQPGQQVAHLSFYLPQTMSPGRYTFAIQGKTTVPTGPKGKDGKWKTRAVTIVTNPITIHVQPATFVVEIDPYSPKRIHRGEVVQVKYTAKRTNGFIGKIHTELYAAGGVIGLRGRGNTFVGQTESGTIQIIANEDAPLGQQPSLRLFGVGVVEDEAVYYGSCFLPLEIIE
jgi:hypothetical protein